RVAHLLLGRTRREAVGGVLDPGLRALLEEVLSYSGVKSQLAAVGPDPAPAPVAAISFRKDSLAADFFSTVTTLGTPQDVALQEMRIECFFPANQQTRESPFFSGPARWSDLPAQPGV
ncbi:MAG: hypothetical protein KC910_34790, partial [Candidatus Eremiobacteraeota bacterium]|nr:hypothetical protein [Candidatus Eremiobacteraeota bacterium]